MPDKICGHTAQTAVLQYSCIFLAHSACNHRFRMMEKCLADCGPCRVLLIICPTTYLSLQARVMKPEL